VLHFLLFIVFFYLFLVHLYLGYYFSSVAPLLGYYFSRVVPLLGDFSSRVLAGPSLVYFLIIADLEFVLVSFNPLPFLVISPKEKSREL
jgi:hypothetical protein